MLEALVAEDDATGPRRFVGRLVDELTQPLARLRSGRTELLEQTEIAWANRLNRIT